MDREHVLRLYDEELRRRAPFFDEHLRLEQADPVVRLVGATADAGNNCVLYSALDDTTAGAIIDREVSYFTALRHSFEWKYHDHDPPTALPQLLRERGFESGEPEQILAVELAGWTDTSTLPPEYRVQRLTEGESLKTIQQVQEAVWPELSHGWLLESLQRERTAAPHAIDFYVIWANEQPVCAGWMRYNGRFASLFGGSTLLLHRGRGLYRALLAARLRDAQQRAVEFAVVDAGPMSRPILQRLGFVALTGTTPYVYRGTAA